MDEFFHPTETVPDEITCPDGVKATRDLGAELRGSSEYRAAWGKWPLESAAMGVHPNQVEANMRRFPHHKFNRETGNMIFDSPQHRKRCLKDVSEAMGVRYYDLDAV